MASHKHLSIVVIAICGVLCFYAGNVFVGVKQSATIARLRADTLEKFKLSFNVVENSAIANGGRIPSLTVLRGQFADVKRQHAFMTGTIAINVQVIGMTLSAIEPDCPILFSVQSNGTDFLVAAQLKEGAMAWDGAHVVSMNDSPARVFTSRSWKNLLQKYSGSIYRR